MFYLLSMLIFLTLYFMYNYILDIYVGFKIAGSPSYSANYGLILFIAYWGFIICLGTYGGGITLY